MTALKAPEDILPTGRPSKYKPEFDEEIVRLASMTIKNHMYRIAVMFGVCIDTLHEWRRVHKTFSEAYMRARGFQNAFLFDLIIDGSTDRNFNGQAANLLTTHLAALSRDRMIKVDVKGETLGEKSKSIIDDLRSGAMSAQEFNLVMGGIATAAKIDEVTDLRDKVEKLENESGS